MIFPRGFCSFLLLVKEGEEVGAKKEDILIWGTKKERRILMLKSQFFP